ncbi:MAG: hypothetical protein ACQCN3_02785 [Candidatus Bathyarchaeia archaeon]
MENKQLQWSLFFVIFIASTVYYLIVGLGNLGVFAVTAAYSIFGAIALVILRSTRSDEPYYVNMNLKGLLVTLGVVGIMILTASSLSSILVANPLPSESVIPQSFVQNVMFPLESMPRLGIVQVPSSYTTILFSDIGFNVFMVSFVETLLVFAAISALRDGLGPYATVAKKSKRFGCYVLLTVFCFVEPVLMWVLWHGLEAYSDWWLLVPAFVNGLYLIFLNFTKDLKGAKLGVVAAVIAHGFYNSYITVLNYLQGNVTAVQNMPFLPVSWTPADIYILFVLFPLGFGCLFIPLCLGRNESV